MDTEHDARSLALDREGTRLMIDERRLIDGDPVVGRRGSLRARCRRYHGRKRQK